MSAKHVLALSLVLLASVALESEGSVEAASWNTLFAEKSATSQGLKEATQDGEGSGSSEVEDDLLGGEIVGMASAGASPTRSDSDDDIEILEDAMTPDDNNAGSDGSTWDVSSDDEEVQIDITCDTSSLYLMLLSSIVSFLVVLMLFLICRWET